MLDQVITRRRGIAAGVLVVLLALPVVGCKPEGYLAPADVTKVVILHLGTERREKVYAAGDENLRRIVSLYNEAERASAPNQETTPGYTVRFETRQGWAAAVHFSFADPVLGVVTRDGKEFGIVSDELEEMAREATE